MTRTTDEFFFLTTASAFVSFASLGVPLGSLVYPLAERT